MTETPDCRSETMDSSEGIGRARDRWIAWRQAGGFARLERGGWHRATIFRKIRRFRATFGAHPDAYVFPWITLDLSHAWRTDLLARLEPHPATARPTTRSPEDVPPLPTPTPPTS